MKKSQSTFWIKGLLLFAPFILLTVVYLVDDPFMVLHHYNKYDKSRFFLNEHYVEWQTYLNNKDSVHYNSFLFGNSCTMAFQCTDWEKYLNKSDRAIRFYGNDERLTAVYKKLHALDKTHANIKNVLFVVDRNLLTKTTLNGTALSTLPPVMSDITDIQFQIHFIQFFFTPSYLTAYCDYGLFHHYRPYMKGIINTSKKLYNPITYDIYNPREKEISIKGNRFWIDHKNEFPHHCSHHIIDKPILFGEEKYILSEIGNICRKHHAEIKIIISPDYDQKQINPADVQALRQIFGKNNVYDFTGINTYTTDIHNFYDKTHYRPVLGNELLKRIYRNPNS